MEEAVLRVSSLIFFIAVGYGLRRSALVDATCFRVISNLVFYITLPCLIITSINGQPIGTSFLMLIVCGLLGNFIMVGAGYFMGRKEGAGHRAFSMLTLSGYNIGLFSMPFVSGFLSPLGFLAVCLFDAGNSVMCTGGTYAMASGVLEGRSGMTPKKMAKKLFSSMSFCVYLIMIPMALLHLAFPQGLVDFLKVGAQANAFLCMIMIGVNIRLTLNEHDAKDMARLLAVRYIFAALSSLALYQLLPFSQDVRKAMAIIAFAPMSSVALIFLFRLKGNVELAATLNSASVLLSVVCMTILMVLL